MLVCLTCWEVLDSNVLNRANDDSLWCPKKNCAQEVVDIDECIILVIQELNEKGYMTVACCSGHFWDGLPESSFPPYTYILFDESVEPVDLPNLPDGFKIELNRGGAGFSIRKKYDIEDPMGLHIAILKTAIELTTWARGLAELPGE